MQSRKSRPKSKLQHQTGENAGCSVQGQCSRENRGVESICTVAVAGGGCCYPPHVPFAVGFGREGKLAERALVRTLTIMCA